MLPLLAISRLQCDAIAAWHFSPFTQVQVYVLREGRSPVQVADVHMSAHCYRDRTVFIRSIRCDGLELASDRDEALVRGGGGHCLPVAVGMARFPGWLRNCMAKCERRPHCMASRTRGASFLALKVDVRLWP